jgi:hypothetical protein
MYLSRSQPCPSHVYKYRKKDSISNFFSRLQEPNPGLKKWTALETKTNETERNSLSNRIRRHGANSRNIFECAGVRNALDELLAERLQTPFGRRGHFFPGAWFLIAVMTIETLIYQENKEFAIW